MKELSIKEIEHNWKKLRDIIENTFDDDRLINLNKMYDYFEDRMCMKPSGKEHYHYTCWWLCRTRSSHHRLCITN